MKKANLQFGPLMLDSGEDADWINLEMALPENLDPATLRTLDREIRLAMNAVFTRVMEATGRWPKAMAAATNPTAEN